MHELYYPPMYTLRLTAAQTVDYLWEKSYFARQLLLSNHQVRAIKLGKIAGAKRYEVLNNRGEVLLKGEIK